MQTKGTKGFVELSLYLRVVLMINDFPHLKTHYEIFIIKGVYLLFPFLAAYVDFPKLPGAEGSTQQASTVYFVQINPQKVSEIETVKANSILGEKYPSLAPFLTFSCVQ